MSYIGNEPIVSATRTITEITATAGQTVFVANGGYTVGYIDVFVNGAQLQTSDFTATNGSSITLVSPATIGDDIRLVAWGTFTTSSSYTQAQADTLLAAKLNTSTNVGFKNRIINGDMRIDQRNAGASVTLSTDNRFPVDRFAGYADTDGVMTAQRDTSAPPRFVNSIKFTTTTADASLGSTQVATAFQNIEGTNVADFGWGTANAATVTLSFWVRSSLTGTFGGALVNTNGTRSYPFTYTIAAANTWEQKSVTIPGDTSGTWLTDTGVGIRVRFSLGAGSTWGGTAGAWTGSNLFSATGATSVIGTLNATWYITGVQLEVGSSATPFDTRAYGAELALCQRYYETSGAAAVVCGFSRSDGLILIPIYFAVDKRAAPTVTFSTILTATNIGTRGCAGTATYGGSSAYSAAYTASIEL